MNPDGFFTSNPFSQQIINEYKYATDSEIENSLAETDKARKTWKDSSAQERIDFFHSLANNFRKYSEPLAKMITIEMGKPLTESLAEVEKSISAIEYYALNLEAFKKDEFVDSKRFVQKSSLGPVLAIMPWNFPVWQVIRCAIPALAAGNSILLKHSDLVAGTSRLLGQIFRETEGDVILFQEIILSHEQTAKVISDTRVQVVSFTGSRSGGAKVAQTSGFFIKKTILELGGSDPYIVFEDADLELAAKSLVQSRLQNNGQSCIAAKRFLIQKSIRSEFLPLLWEEMSKYPCANPMNPSTVRGPLAHARFKENLKIQVRDLIKQGALVKFSSDDHSESSCFYPVQCFEVSRELIKKYPEELFGPVALMSDFNSAEEAISMSNHEHFGLGAAVFSSNEVFAKKVATQLDCGMVSINGVLKSQVDLPFGGIKDSGYGRELSQYGFHEFTNFKSIHTI